MDSIYAKLLIAAGSIGAASFYVPFKKVKEWAWESYWISRGVFAWIIIPWLFAFIFIPRGELIPIIREAPASAMLMASFFGVLWGFGGLTFGLNLRYLGVAPGESITPGLCAAFGTLLPPIITGDNLFSTTGGIIRACFNFGFEAERPIETIAPVHGTKPIFQSNPTLIFILLPINRDDFPFHGTSCHPSDGKL